MTTRTVEIQQPVERAWERLQAAAAAVGKVEEANDLSHYLIMKARYGLNPVRVRISVVSGAGENTSRLEIQGRGQDLWGVASRKVIDRLCANL